MSHKGTHASVDSSMLVFNSDNPTAHSLLAKTAAKAHLRCFLRSELGPVSHVATLPGRQRRFVAAAEADLAQAKLLRGVDFYWIGQEV